MRNSLLTEGTCSAPITTHLIKRWLQSICCGVIRETYLASLLECDEPGFALTLPTFSNSVLLRWRIWRGWGHYLGLEDPHHWTRHWVPWTLQGVPWTPPGSFIVWPTKLDLQGVGHSVRSHLGRVWIRSAAQAMRLGKFCSWQQSLMEPRTKLTIFLAQRLLDFHVGWMHIISSHSRWESEPLNPSTPPLPLEQRLRPGSFLSSLPLPFPLSPTCRHLPDGSSSGPCTPSMFSCHMCCILLRAPRRRSPKTWRFWALFHYSLACMLHSGQRIS